MSRDYKPWAVLAIVIVLLLYSQGYLDNYLNAAYDSSESTISFSQPVCSPTAITSYLDTPNSVVRGETLKIYAASKSQIFKERTFNPSGSTYTYAGCPDVAIYFDNTKLTSNTEFCGGVQRTLAYGTYTTEPNSFSPCGPIAALQYEMPTASIAPGWHILTAYYPGTDNTAQVGAWKKIYITPQDCSIGNNEMLVTQEFAAGTTIRKSGLRWAVSRWCDNAPPIILRSDTNRIEQDYSILTALDIAGSYTVPPSRVVSISYITTTPTDLARKCLTTESYYADGDYCGLPGMVHYCGKDATYDATAGTCTVQSIFNCEPGSFWSEAAKGCVRNTCSDGAYWSTTLKTCLKSVSADLCGVGGALNLAAGNCILTDSYYECVLDPNKVESWQVETLPARVNQGCNVIGCPGEYGCTKFDTGISDDMCISRGSSSIVRDVDTGKTVSCSYAFLKTIVCDPGYTLNDQKTACLQKPPSERVPCDANEVYNSVSNKCEETPGSVIKCDPMHSYEPSVDKCVREPDRGCLSTETLDEKTGACLSKPEVLKAPDVVTLSAGQAAKDVNPNNPAGVSNTVLALLIIGGLVVLYLIFKR